MNAPNLEFSRMLLASFIKNKDKSKKDYNCTIFRRRSKLLNKFIYTHKEIITFREKYKHNNKKKQKKV